MIPALALLSTPGCSPGTDPVTSPQPTVSARPTASLPAGLPPSFEGAVPAGDVPAAALVPLGADVSGSWATRTDAGESIVVAWSVPGPGPLRHDPGVAAWRRFEDGGGPRRPGRGGGFPVRRGPDPGGVGGIA